MKPIFLTQARAWSVACLLVVTIGLAGCSSDNPTTPTSDVDPQVAANLVGGLEGPAEFGTTMSDLDMFQSPLQSLAADAGVGSEAPLAGDWNDEGVGYDYPNKALMTAAAFRGVLLTRDTGITATASIGSPMTRLSRLGLNVTLDKAAGDTIAVEYFDSPDSSGLNALIATDEVNILRLVSQRTYPNAGLLQIAERHSEIVLDTNGTLETGDDDSYFSVDHGFTRGNGEQTTGSIAAVDGVSAMGPGVQVRAYHRVDDPSFHILQAFNEAEIRLDPGEFEVENDEIVYELRVTVQWRNGAEHTLMVAPVADAAIEPDTEVLISATFTASPGNNWLESTTDTLRARLGDLDDESDDLLFEITRSEVFDAIAADGGQARNFVRLTPAEPLSPGDEPCGGTAEQDVHYPATWWLLHLTRSVDIACDGSGSMTVTMEFLDGSSYTRTITWDGQGAAIIFENRADGTTVNGSFHEATGAYSLVTTYADGHDPVSRDRHGTAVDGAIEAWETVVWLDGHDDETYFSVVESESGTTATGYRLEGGIREDFTLASQADGDLSGSWSRTGGATGNFAVDVLEGGGYRLTFSASDPNADGSPSVTGQVDYAPDGSGTGTVTFTQYGNSVTYTVTFGPDGNGTLTDAAGGVYSL